MAMNFNLFPGDIVKYQIKDLKTGKTTFKYAVYLYSYLRKNYRHRDTTDVPVMVLGRLFLNKSWVYRTPINGNRYERLQFVSGLYMKKIFLWKNDTVEVISQKSFPIPQMSVEESVFLSLASDIVQSDYSKLKYSHE